MPFYQDLSEAYDALFPVSEPLRDLLLLLKDAVPVRRVADAGCGSGSQLAVLADVGVDAIGFDPDPSMVALARKRFDNSSSVTIGEGGFADLQRFVVDPVDLLLCLGNSIVHVPNDEAVAFFRNAANVVRPGGILLLQLLNYERLRKAGDADLPLISSANGAAELRRRYEWNGGGSVRFKTVLKLSSPEGPVVRRNEVTLHPLDPDHAWHRLEESGFEPAFFGSFERTAFSPDAEALVVIARKR